jgi:4-amino-4-deoxychorismate lyase
VTYVDGTKCAVLPSDDRGLQYGDGLFETLALSGQTPQHWALHLARLQDGARRLGIACPASDLWRQDLAAASAGLSGRHVAKLILTRGSGGRGYTPPTDARPRRIVQISPWPTWPGVTPEHGVRVIECSVPLGRNRVLAGIKHLNRLEQVLASAEIAAAGADEGLMFDDRAQLVEGTRSNVFLVIDGALCTPRLDEAGVHGVMRTLVMKAADSLSVAVSEQAVSRATLAQASELFLCNSLIGLWPVREIDGPAPRRYADFALTRRLIGALRDEGSLA